jgi:hypothetical protein
MKKHDLPAMPFYLGDWRKAPEVRALDLDVRMIWFEMIGLMWESTERGYLTLNNKPVSSSVITRMLGVDITQFERAIRQMEEFNVFSKREDGAIYCRKMVRDEEIRQLKSHAGKEGMKHRYNKSVITGDITEALTNREDESEIVNINTIEFIDNNIIYINEKKFNFNLLSLIEKKHILEYCIKNNQWSWFVQYGIPETLRIEELFNIYKEKYYIEFKKCFDTPDLLNNTINQTRRIETMTIPKIKEFLTKIKTSREFLNGVDKELIHFSNWIKFNKE